MGDDGKSTRGGGRGGEEVERFRSWEGAVEELGRGMRSTKSALIYEDRLIKMVGRTAAKRPEEVKRCDEEEGEEEAIDEGVEASSPGDGEATKTGEKSESGENKYQ